MQSQKNKIGTSVSTLILITLVFPLFYVILRYHIFGGVAWKDFPLFILNKSMAFSGFIFISYNFSFAPLHNLGIKIPQSWLEKRHIFAMIGFLLILIHALMSFLLFSPQTYSKFFEADGSLTLMAGISMLGGILGFVILWMMNLTFQSYMREDKAFVTFISSRIFLLWALILGGVHLLFMGYKGWIHPLEWHGGMPPVSLVAMLFFVIGYGANVLGRK